MRVLGIDLGIASCGWAVLEPDGETPRLSPRAFAVLMRRWSTRPASPATQERSPSRRARPASRHPTPQTALAERASDPSTLRFAGLHSRNALWEALRRLQIQACGANVTPWGLRKAAHDRLLSDDDFSVVLGHIARHRGFRSNSKRDAGANAADETSKMKKAMEQTREGLAKYRSFGEMIESDPKFMDRKRNRDKDYSHTPKRSDLEDELHSIFAAQRRFAERARHTRSRS